jgi:hypothetical protein
MKTSFQCNEHFDDQQPTVVSQYGNGSINCTLSIYRVLRILDVWSASLETFSSDGRRRDGHPPSTLFVCRVHAISVSFWQDNHSGHVYHLFHCALRVTGGKQFDACSGLH